MSRFRKPDAVADARREYDRLKVAVPKAKRGSSEWRELMAAKGDAAKKVTAAERAAKKAPPAASGRVMVTVPEMPWLKKSDSPSAAPAPASSGPSPAPSDTAPSSPSTAQP